MDRDYATHWTLGIICAVIWFWGDQAHIPKEAIALAASVVPGILAHALAYTPPAKELPKSTTTKGDSNV